MFSSKKQGLVRHAQKKRLNHKFGCRNGCHDLKEGFQGFQGIQGFQKSITVAEINLAHFDHSNLINVLYLFALMLMIMPMITTRLIV